MSDFTIAGESYKEEKKAVRDYTTRIGQANSTQLKKHLNHALGEEKEHVRLFKKDLKKKRYSAGEVNQAREMVGEGKASNVPKLFARGGRY